MATPDRDWGWATEYEDIRGAVAVCGVGESDHTKASGRTATEIVAQAAERAIADAGLSPADIDGLMYSQFGGRLDGTDFHAHFGTRHDLWESRAGGGTRQAATAPYEAAAALRSGQARYILNTFGVAWATQRSADGRRSRRIPRPGAVQAEPRGAVRMVPPARLLRHGGASAHARVRHHPGAARRGGGRVPPPRQPHPGRGDARPSPVDGAVPGVAADRGAVPTRGLLLDLRRRRRVHHDDTGAGAGPADRRSWRSRASGSATR